MPTAPHTREHYPVTSQAVRRDSSLKPSGMKNIRPAFKEIASRKHAAHRPLLLEQLSAVSFSHDGAPSSSSGARQEDLRCALLTTIGSFNALETLYERREMRWAEEKLKLDEDKEKVQLLLTQVQGVSPTRQHK
ncbi:hypothetical protein EI94DRAFT_1730875 [Lactarius quietus]|nr:hypothetical protein EI94DRAFT_1730875 [Lactarius quietus]